MKKAPSISVVVPVANSEASLERCLRSIRKSTIPVERLVVVDHSSKDKSIEIAREYADLIIEADSAARIMEVRFCGFAKCESDIVVNVDSDTIIRPDTLELIRDVFQHSPDCQVLTGMLSVETPQGGFFSRYKNQYMNYTFRRLPREITFLYGSIFAMRDSTRVFAAENLLSHCTLFPDDTEMGLLLSSSGVQIQFIKELEVIHLKPYSFLGIIKNDFRIPRTMAGLLKKYRNINLPFIERPAFVHTSYGQVICIGLAYLTLFSFAIGYCGMSFSLLLLWGAFNFRFFKFLSQHNPIKPLFASILFTFLDQLTMGAGIFFGIVENFGRVEQDS